MTIAINTENSEGCTLNDLQQIFRLRKKVFVDRLNWKVETVGAYEFDDFDTEDTDYLVVRQRGKIVATCRLITTDHATMLSDIFPELLRGEILFPEPTVCEISRLSSMGTRELKRGVLPFVLQGLRAHAEENGIKEYVFVTTTTIERLLRRFGVTIQRFGDGEVTDLDGVKSVAIRMDASSIPLMQ